MMKLMPKTMKAYQGLAKIGKMHNALILESVNAEINVSVLGDKFLVSRKDIIGKATPFQTYSRHLSQ